MRALPPPSAVVDARGRLACRFCADRLEIAGNPCYPESYAVSYEHCDWCSVRIAEIALADLETYRNADGDQPAYRKV